MRALLDTHGLLWFLLDDPKLPQVAKGIIADGSNDIAVSPASYWEIAIKISLGKYRLPEPYGPFMERELAQNRFESCRSSRGTPACSRTCRSTTATPSIAC